jgi:alanine-glyoxylate transaminase/serine-glyoxylate transaminase/serine-pyruvate transaminase
LRAGLEAIGVGLFADPAHRLNPLTTAVIPDGVEDAKVRTSLLEDYNIEISGGLGDTRGRIWRIGLMGDSARDRNVLALLSALEQILNASGYEVAYGSSLAAAQKALAARPSG